MYRTLKDIKRANHNAYRRGELGAYWFEPGAMRFFATRILEGVIGGRFFITSERFESPRGNGPRRYSIRVCHPDGSIDTVGEFQGFETARQARRTAERYASGEVCPHVEVSTDPNGIGERCDDCGAYIS